MTNQGRARQTNIQTDRKTGRKKVRNTTILGSETTKFKLTAVYVINEPKLILYIIKFLVKSYIVE